MKQVVDNMADSMQTMQGSVSGVKRVIDHTFTMVSELKRQHKTILKDNKEVKKLVRLLNKPAATT